MDRESEEDNFWEEKGMKKSVIMLWIAIIFLSITFSIPPANAEEISLACKLAVINYKDGLIKEGDWRVVQFKRLLDSLEKKCRNKRENIADILVKGVEILEKKHGIKMSLLAFAEGLNQSIPPDSKSLNLDLAEVGAVYVTLIINERGY